MSLDPADCRVLSVRIREGLQRYGVKPNEFLLAHMLCLETLDRGQERGRVRLEEWAREMGMVEEKGVRADKCEKILRSLIELGIVDVNFAQGTFELRPCAQDWSRLRAFRYAPRSDAGGELPLSAERPLSESLSELSREKALEGGSAPNQDWPTLFTLWCRAFQAGPAAIEKFRREHPEAAARIDSAEKSADEPSGFRRKNPPTDSAKFAEVGKPQSPQVFAAGLNPAKSLSAEKSADTAVASLASSVQKAQLATAASPPSAEKSAEALKWVTSVDRMGQLEDPNYGPQWIELCQRYPNYVMSRLKPRFELKEKEEQLTDPLAYLSRKAREEGRMRR